MTADDEGVPADATTADARGPYSEDLAVRLAELEEVEADLRRELDRLDGR